MSRKKSYMASHVVDLDRMEIIFVGVDDVSSSASQRSEEVIYLATKMYKLALRAGRVSKWEREEFNESA